MNVVSGTHSGMCSAGMRSGVGDDSKFASFGIGATNLRVGEEVRHDAGSNADVPSGVLNRLRLVAEDRASGIISVREDLTVTESDSEIHWAGSLQEGRDLVVREYGVFRASRDFDDISPLEGEVCSRGKMIAEEDGDGFGLFETVNEERLIAGEIEMTVWAEIGRVDEVFESD